MFDESFLTRFDNMKQNWKELGNSDYAKWVSSSFLPKSVYATKGRISQKYRVERFIFPPFGLSSYLNSIFKPISMGFNT